MIGLFFKRLTFKSRLRIAFIFLVTLSIAFTGWMSYRISAEQVQTNALKMSQDTLNKSSQAFDEKLKRFPQSLIALFVSDPYNRLLNDVVAGDTSRNYIHYSRLQTSFMQLTLNEELLDSILLVTPIGDFYLADDVRTHQDFKETNMYKRIEEDKRAVWVEGHEDPFFSKKNVVVSLVLPAFGNRLDVRDTYVVMNIEESGLQQFLTGNISDWQDGVTIVNKDGTSVFQKSRFAYPSLLHYANFTDRLMSGEEGSFDYRYQGDDYLVNYSKSKVIQDWTFISVKPKHELLKQVDTIKWTTLAVTLVAILLSVLISNVFTELLTKPLMKLKKLMRRAGQKDLNVRYRIHGNDEFTQVGLQFNRMLEQINKLIQDVKHAEQEKHRAEIKALQAQIDPHFLYNTLNTIYWKSTLHKEEDVQEMVMSLSHLFQLGLNGGKEMTTVEKEIAHVTKYLTIQQKCYDDLFAYVIEIDEQLNIKEQPILKIILQPLVENSIIHGFKNIRENGLIAIRLTGEGERMVITVADNGEGMDTESVRQTITQQRDGHKGFALYNIFRRLQLYYQDNADIQLDSTPGSGTVVTLSIPLGGGRY